MLFVEFGTFQEKWNLSDKVVESQIEAVYHEELKVFVVNLELLLMRKRTMIVCWLQISRCDGTSLSGFETKPELLIQLSRLFVQVLHGQRRLNDG